MNLSVIVPVGNVEAWRECEKSLYDSIQACQLNAEIEVLPCFDVCHKGVFVPRNEGLNRAKGEWIAWVDCDDVVELNWAQVIVSAIRNHPDVDIIQINLTEEFRGKCRKVNYKYSGLVQAETFAMEMLRGAGMPAWLVTRIMKRSLIGNNRFTLKVFEDYDLFLSILPRVRKVWAVNEHIYRYKRNESGLSSYNERLDFHLVGQTLENHILALPRLWRNEARKGLALMMADVSRHSKHSFAVWPYVAKGLFCILGDPDISLRLKVKTILAVLCL